MSSASADNLARLSGTAVLLCLVVCTAEASLALDSRFGSTLQEIQAGSPYKYVRDAILAAEGETKAITCSFDNLYTAGKHWKRTFYSPVNWFLHTKSGAEEPITDGKTLQLDGGRMFAYKLTNPMSVAPSSILVLENVPLQLSGSYFVCRTSLQPGSVQAFYLKVIKPVLFTPGASGGRVQARLGARLTLDCSSANNFPMTSVHWSRQRMSMKLAAGRSVLAWGPTYELGRVSMEAAQYQYACHVNNHLDPEWTVNFRIDLINGTKLMPGPITATYNGVRPAFRTRSSQAVPRYQSTYTISCRVQGDGVKFTWMKNGSEIRPYADPNLYTYSSSQGKQHFTDLVLKKFSPRDSGFYECLARNEAGDRRFVFDLENVRASPPPGPDRPDLPVPGAAGVGGIRQQQHLGSGWGGGSGDDEADATSAAASAASAATAPSGDRGPPPPLPPTPPPSPPPLASAGRVRRHWRGRTRNLVLPTGQ